MARTLVRFDETHLNRDWDSDEFVGVCCLLRRVSPQAQVSRGVFPWGERPRRTFEVNKMMGWNLDGGAWLGMGFGMLLWLALGVIVVWLIVRGLIALERTRTDGPPRSGADEILRERFARGEIDGEEFERRLGVLHGK